MTETRAAWWASSQSDLWGSPQAPCSNSDFGQKVGLYGQLCDLPAPIYQKTYTKSPALPAASWGFIGKTLQIYEHQRLFVCKWDQSCPCFEICRSAGAAISRNLNKAAALEMWDFLLLPPFLESPFLESVWWEPTGCLSFFLMFSQAGSRIEPWPLNKKGAQRANYLLLGNGSNQVKFNRGKRQVGLTDGKRSSSGYVCLCSGPLTASRTSTPAKPSGRPPETRPGLAIPRRG